MPAADLYASGTQEDRIHEAKQLVDERKYNDAIFVLTEMLKSEPARMDEIQALLLRVRNEKENYNKLYEDLIETYGGDNVEAAYPIIKELEELDPLPNEATRESLVLARETAGFVFNNNRWVDIMERASALLAEQEWEAAILTYMEGFDLSRDIFKDSGYGNIDVDEVFARAGKVDELSREIVEIYPDFINKADLAEEAFRKRNAAGFIEAIEQIYPDLKRAAEVREELKDASDYFLTKEESLRNSRRDDKQIHYLIYLDRLLNGRTTVDEKEGITGAVHLFWNDFYRKMEADSTKFAEELFFAANQHYTEGDLEAAADGFRDVVLMAESVRLTLDNGNAFGKENIDASRDPLLTLDEDLLKSDSYFIADSIRASESFQEIIEKRRRLNELKSRIAAIDEFSDVMRETGGGIKAGLAGETVSIYEQLQLWQNRKNEILQLETGGISVDRSVAAVAIQIDELSAMLKEAVNAEIGLTALMAEIELAVFDTELDRLLVAVDESRQLIEGVPEAGTDDGELEFEVTYKYPEEAVSKVLMTESDLRVLIDGIREVERLIDGERDDIKSGAPVAGAAEHASELMRKSGIQLARANALGDKAREQIFTAEKLKQEGERRIEEARNLTRRAQFKAAKEKLEAAAGKFDESLSYREDPVLRKYRDEEIPRLYEEIQTAENNLVVAQVREYLTSGKASYSQGNFAIAQSIMIKAQSRWSDTNIEPNAEVEYWLTLAKTALSVTSGRVIAPTDPLYAEMNQYLNQAQTDFLKAKDEYSAGGGADADFYFNRAEQSILIVQQFFPFNEEARVLNLRISQYRNPERFNELFKTDFQTARRLIATNPQKAYIDLKDLEAINAQYSGLKSAIIEAEYAAGIKVRPPDPDKLRRSTELYKLAFSIVSRNIRSEFNVALSYLDEAISLNTDNLEAIRLKDRISADVGGTATIVMSNTDQQVYQEAVSEYTAGNYLKARILVENLLKNPDNQRNTKLIDLKERIDRTR
ncbi:MAG: hypothetical protein JEZ04_15865 [Spirochaetales bacterium]|nr:hypothetical protein [Spirochaetales bacterium]